MEIDLKISFIYMWNDPYTDNYNVIVALNT